jgi:chaperone required for assembly of F1-ATPase
MPELFETSDPDNPMTAAQRNARPALRQRFYQHAGTASGADSHAVQLDGKAVHTPARRPLAAPSLPLAQALAAEWDAQRDKIDPATMPLTRLVNSIIDGVVPDPAPVADEIVKYAGSDLICYRAGNPDSLVARQAKAWDPVLAWARDSLGARFILSEGIVHVAQPETALSAVRAALPRDGWRLGALHVLTTLTGSALLALALEKGRLTPAELWSAAHVDEDFQTELWGQDEDAAERRQVREREMLAAATVLASL